MHPAVDRSEFAWKRSSGQGQLVPWLLMVSERAGASDVLADPSGGSESVARPSTEQGHVTPDRCPPERKSHTSTEAAGRQIDRLPLLKAACGDLKSEGPVSSPERLTTAEGASRTWEAATPGTDKHAPKSLRTAGEKNIVNIARTSLGHHSAKPSGSTQESLGDNFTRTKSNADTGRVVVHGEHDWLTLARRRNLQKERSVRSRLDAGTDGPVLSRRPHSDVGACRLVVPVEYRGRPLDCHGGCLVKRGCATAVRRHRDGTVRAVCVGVDRPTVEY